MDYIQQIRQNLKTQSQESNILNLIDEQIRLHEQGFVKSIKDRWLSGLDPNGGKIGSYSGFPYAEKKNKRNSKAGFWNVDLTLTGLMGNELVLNEISKTQHVFGSQVSYFNDVVERYGLKQFNITEAERDAFLSSAYAEIIMICLNKAYE